MAKLKRVSTAEIRRLRSWFSPRHAAAAKRTYPALATAARPALLLGQRMAGKAGLGLLESKLGGVFGWPKGESAPERFSKRLHPIIQLRRDEFPLIPFPKGRNIFQLFWRPQDIRVEVALQRKAGLNTLPLPAGRAPLVKWWNTSELTSGVSAPEVATSHKGLVPGCCCQLQPGLVDDLPDDLTDVPGLTKDALMADRNLDSCIHFSHAKVGGYPSWTPAGRPTPQCQCGRSMSLLLSLCPLIHDGRGGWHNPSGLFEQFGGTWMLFVCGACPDSPVTAVSQLY